MCGECCAARHPRRKPGGFHHCSHSSRHTAEGRRTSLDPTPHAAQLGAYLSNSNASRPAGLTASTGTCGRTRSHCPAIRSRQHVSVCFGWSFRFCMLFYSAHSHSQHARQLMASLPHPPGLDPQKPKMHTGGAVKPGSCWLRCWSSLRRHIASTKALPTLYSFTRTVPSTNCCVLSTSSCGHRNTQVTGGLVHGRFH